MTPYTVTVPLTDKSGRKRFPRVGAMFENHNNETGEVFYTVRLDFPVGATEFLVFPPRAAEARAEEEADGSAAEAVAEAPETTETEALAASAAR